MAVRTHVNQLVANVAGASDYSGEAVQRSSANRQVQEAVGALTLYLAHAIREARQKARADTRALLAGHMAEDGIDMDASAPIDDAEDAAAARVAASSYASAWGALALIAIRRWATGKERSIAGALARTIGQSDGRIRRIAATENAMAMSGEAARVAQEATEASDPSKGPGVAKARGGEAAEAGAYRTPGDVEPVDRLVKVWSAMLDNKVCPSCGAMHGTVVRADDEFPGGDMPRHNFCRCIPVIFMAPGTLKEIERAWAASGIDDVRRKAA